MVGTVRKAAASPTSVGSLGADQGTLRVDRQADPDVSPPAKAGAAFRPYALADLASAPSGVT